MRNVRTSLLDAPTSLSARVCLLRGEKASSHCQQSCAISTSYGRGKREQIFFNKLVLQDGCLDEVCVINISEQSSKKLGIVTVLPVLSTSVLPVLSTSPLSHFL